MTTTALPLLANHDDPMLRLAVAAHLARYKGETRVHTASVLNSYLRWWPMIHAVRGFFRFAHIDGLMVANPAVYAWLPKIHGDESRTQGLDRLELIRFLQIAQTLTVHHGALAYLLGINTHAVRRRICQV